MFLIIGFGNQTSKEYGVMPEQLCGRCRNQTARPLTKVTSWFTLFFIPLIPYKSKYMLVCPICNDPRELDKFEFEELVKNIAPREDRDNYGEGADSANSANSSGNGVRVGNQASQRAKHESDAERFAGKNARQIAFLKKMEAAEKAMSEKE